jgi:hypothetical protein
MGGGARGGGARPLRHVSTWRHLNRFVPAPGHTVPLESAPAKLRVKLMASSGSS